MQVLLRYGRIFYMSVEQTIPKSLRIGVLRGGPSSEYEVSLKTGGNVLKELGDTHSPIDIFISKDGKWHIQGIERSPERILRQVDVVWNGLHGTFGEDGGVQHILDIHGIPYTGSKKFESAIAMNKWLTKEKLKSHGVKTPVAMLVRREDSLVEKAEEVFNSIPHPLIVKPVSGSSSVGLHVTQSFNELLSALEEVLATEDSALVEECISGKEATCGVVQNFRQKEVYTLPPVEIIPPKGKLFDYESKYNGQSQEICPGNFSDSEKREIERIAGLVHSALGLSHYSRSDFIVTPRRGIYFLEVNTLPGLTEESLFPKSLKTVGVSFKEFLDHVLKLAIYETGIWL